MKIWNEYVGIITNPYILILLRSTKCSQLEMIISLFPSCLSNGFQLLIVEVEKNNGMEYSSKKGMVKWHNRN